MAERHDPKKLEKGLQPVRPHTSTAADGKEEAGLQPVSPSKPNTGEGTPGTGGEKR